MLFQFPMFTFSHGFTSNEKPPFPLKIHHAHLSTLSNIPFNQILTSATFYLSCKYHQKALTAYSPVSGSFFRSAYPTSLFLKVDIPRKPIHV